MLSTNVAYLNPSVKGEGHPISSKRAQRSVHKISFEKNFEIWASIVSQIFSSQVPKFVNSQFIRHPFRDKNQITTSFASPNLGKGWLMIINYRNIKLNIDQKVLKTADICDLVWKWYVICGTGLSYMYVYEMCRKNSTICYCFYR